MHGLNFFARRRYIGGAQCGVSRVSIGIEEARSSADAHAIVETHFAVDGKDGIMAEFDAIANDKLRLIENAPRSDADMSTKSDVIADHEMTVTVDVGYLREIETGADGVTATAE